MKPFSSGFLFWCAVWIAGSATFSLLANPGVAEERFIFAFSTLCVAGLVWILEHLEWRKS